MNELSFVKMNGWGNDFVILKGPIDLSKADIEAICDRRFGVGADGILVVTPGDPVRMDYRNADGSPAEMCGNGLRCVARYALDEKMVSGPDFVVDTPIGLRHVHVADGEVEVEIGPVSVIGHTSIEGERYHLIDVGNPHAVVEVDDPEMADVAAVGSNVSALPEFPEGTNVEFVKLGTDSLTMRVWERGVGETLACGTGMVAAAFVAIKAAKSRPPIEVRVPGGVGSVDFREETSWLTGPAEYSFTGVWSRSGQG